MNEATISFKNIIIDANGEFVDTSDTTVLWTKILIRCAVQIATVTGMYIVLATTLHWALALLAALTAGQYLATRKPVTKACDAAAEASVKGLRRFANYLRK